VKAAFLSSQSIMVRDNPSWSRDGTRFRTQRRISNRIGCGGQLPCSPDLRTATLEPVMNLRAMSLHDLTYGSWQALCRRNHGRKPALEGPLGLEVTVWVRQGIGRSK